MSAEDVPAIASGPSARGAQVFAVGPSDSHGISTAPVGYPRTCITLGTDDPRQVADLTPAVAHAGVW